MASVEPPANTPVEFSFRYSPALARLAARRYVQRRAGTQLVLAAIAAGICVLGLFLQPGAWYLIVALVFACVYVLSWGSYYSSADSTCDSLRHPPVTIRLTDGSFGFETDGSSSTVQWSRIQQIWRFREVWLVFPNNLHGYCPIPAEVMSDEVKAFMEKKTTASGGIVK